MLVDKGKKVLDTMKGDGMAPEVLEEFYEVARKAAGVVEIKTVKDIEGKGRKRCKWWNRGFCREKESCAFAHKKEDCEEHLKGRCTKKDCKTLRHRKNCKYFSSEEGCYRGDSCQYLHSEMNIEKEDTKNTDRKSLCDMEVLTKDKNGVKEKNV